MPAIYDRPTKELLTEWANEHLRPGQVFSKVQPLQWFKTNYPGIESSTVKMHVQGMAVNNRNRRHHANVRPGSGHDLFFKIGPDQFRLWDPQTDPAPRYKPDIELEEEGGGDEFDPELGARDEPDQVADGGSAFAYERDLQNYLARNLHVLEPGLTVYEQEGLEGIQFDAGGRFIDILAVDRNGGFVVIELKVSRGYDRVIGQLLRYVGWEPEQRCPGERFYRRQRYFRGLDTGDWAHSRDQVVPVQHRLQHQSRQRRAP
jgi:endonuclease NucS-like protein